MVSFTRRLVRTSTRRTDSSSSAMVIRFTIYDLRFTRAKQMGLVNRKSYIVIALGDYYSAKDILYDSVRRHRLRLGFVGENDTVAQHVRADALDIFGRHVGAALQEGPGLGG